MYDQVSALNPGRRLHEGVGGEASDTHHQEVRRLASLQAMFFEDP